MAKKRGCGLRVAGGIYAEVGLSPEGSPVENFLIDPPVSIDKLPGITPIGVKLYRSEKDGTVHVFDWVGADSYPNVADFIEEVRDMGLSRRLPKSLDFSLLTPKSRIILIHSRAIIPNFKDYYESGHPIVCPKNLPDHRHAPGWAVKETCAGLWWHDLDPDTVREPAVVGGKLEAVAQQVIREMPAFKYEGWARPEKVEPLYRPGMFASFNITKLAVIRDIMRGTHEVAEHAAAASSLPVVIEDE